VTGVVEATESEVAYAISTIFVYNLVAVLVFPIVGHALGLSQNAFGLWAGTAINDTSSVVAAAYAYGHTAGLHAVVVKLTRTTFIVPITLALSIRRAAGSNRKSRIRASRIVPWFLIWFVVAAAVQSGGLVPSSVRGSLQNAALILITVALASIGLSTRLRALRETGGRPFMLGSVVWVVLAAEALALQRLTGHW
jgi:uncharacterized integral membrane protein (TIGR00698 family)